MGLLGCCTCCFSLASGSASAGVFGSCVPPASGASARGARQALLQQQLVFGCPAPPAKARPAIEQLPLSAAVQAAGLADGLSLGIAGFGVTQWNFGDLRAYNALADSNTLRWVELGLGLVVELGWACARRPIASWGTHAPVRSCTSVQEDTCILACIAISAALLLYENMCQTADCGHPATSPLQRGCRGVREERRDRVRHQGRQRAHPQHHVRR